MRFGGSTAVRFILPMALCVALTPWAAAGAARPGPEPVWGHADVTSLPQRVPRPTEEASAPGGDRLPAGMRLLRSDDTGILLSLEPPRFDVSQRSSGEAASWEIEATGYRGDGRSPALPERSLLLAIPPTGTPRLELRVGKPVILADGLRLASSADEPAAAARLPKAVDLPSSEPVTLDQIGWIRNQRIARLRVRPFRYQPDRDMLLAFDRVTATLRFDGLAVPPVRAEGSAFPPAPGSAGQVAFETQVERHLANPDSARAWRTERGPAAPLFDGVMPSESGEIWNIAVRETGMVRLSATALGAAGFPRAAVDPRMIRLFDAGEELAIQVEGEEDGRFDAGDAVVFHGQASESRYAADRVYQLAIGVVPGKRMARRNSRPMGLPPREAYTETLRMEQDRQYDSALPRPAALAPRRDAHDHFFWEQLWSRDPLTLWPALDSLAPGPWTGALRVAVVGKTSFPEIAPDHHLQLWLGQTLLGERRWDGDAGLEHLALPVSSERLMTSPLGLRLELPGVPGTPVDQIYLDWLEIDYRRQLVAREGALRFRLEPGAQGLSDIRVRGFASRALQAYDVSDPMKPVELTGIEVAGPLPTEAQPFALHFGEIASEPRAYAVVEAAAYQTPRSVLRRPPTRLLQPARGADYLLISHADFMPAARELAAARGAQGFAVALIDVQQIYDAFGGGMPEPEAIRDFIGHAYHHWPAPPPSHVLLLGDGHYDPRDRLGTGRQSFIPPFLAAVDPWLGEVASENAFVTVSGEDPIPDLFLGRLPVRSPEEALAAVRKILRYEHEAPEGDWRRSVTFVADDPDEAGDFPALSDRLAEDLLPADMALERLYFGRTTADPAALRQSLIAALGEGRLVVQYIGHAQPTAWGAERFLERADLLDLGNGSRLPLLLDMTCLTGYFDHPTRQSMSEAAVLAAEGGAIAAFSPTGLGVATGHDLLNRGLMSALFEQRIAGLGPVTLAGRLALYSQAPRHEDLHYTYVLLGDPATQLLAPDALAPTPVPSRLPPAFRELFLPVLVTRSDGMHL